MQVLCLYGPRKSKPEWRVNYANSSILCFLTVIIWLVLWQIQKLCYCTVIGLFSLYLRAISKYKPRGIIFGRAIWRRDFVLRVNGGLYLEGLISEFYGNSFHSRWITGLEIFSTTPHHRKRFRRRFFSQLHKFRLYLQWSFLHSAVQNLWTEIHILLFNITRVNLHSKETRMFLDLLSL